MAEYTSLGLAVKTKLLTSPIKTQAQLAKEVSQETGLFVDDAYLSRILTGQRSAPKVIASICKILGIEEPTENEETEGK